jgi:hypothetical protein
MTAQEPLSDAEAIEYIQAILDGSEWNAETAVLTAEVIRSTGRAVRALQEAPSVQECEL